MRACACACTFTTLCNAHLRGVVKEVSWEIIFTKIYILRAKSVFESATAGLPRFIKGLYWVLHGRPVYF